MKIFKPNNRKAEFILSHAFTKSKFKYEESTRHINNNKCKYI